ncbi:MAG: phosphatidate cytidylyltransferase [Mycoplasmataceae bacterium]|nr:phosphatidate cytidylyltransferase [Mycoplasmataceae bacterium]
MIVNKLNKEMKDSMNKRTRSGLLMMCYGFGILFCLTLSDQFSNGWASYLPENIHKNISFAFAIISILSIAWMSIFIARELHHCFIDTNNRKHIIFIAISMLLIQLVPTFIWLYPNYFTVNNKLIWFLAFFISVLVISLFSLPFLFIMVNHSKRPTQFNKIVFPFLVIGIGWTLGCVYYLSIQRYWTTILILVAVVVVCDIVAYFAGILFGKHKMAPTISPKKSWEGAIIGSIASSALIILFIFLFSLIPHIPCSSMDTPFNFFGVQFENYFNNMYKNWVWWVVISLIIITLTFFSICGDLLFSWFKRKNNIKDFGNSLPGHGGFLDRIDSFVVVVVVFAIITFIISIFTIIYHASHDNIDIYKYLFRGWYK